MILHIRAVEAKGIPKMDVIGKADPYLSLRLSSSSTQYKTKVVKKCYEPVWNEEFHIKVNPASDEVLHLELYDWDKVSNDDLISTRDFEIAAFVPGKVSDIWTTFFKAPKVKKPGKVHLVFHLANEGDTPFVEKLIADCSVQMPQSISPLTTQDMSKAREQFAQIDQNCNGLLEEQELDNFFRQSKEELRCFSKLVIEIFGQNGSVNVDQFFTFYKSLTADRNSDEFLGRYIFDYIDSDHSGKIDSQEFQKVVDLIKFPEGTKQDIIDRASEEMDYNEFSKNFYTLLRMAWRGLLRRNTYTPAQAKQ